MRLRAIYLLLLLWAPYLGLAQTKPSKGDVAFFEYAYPKAIKEYHKELKNGTLSNTQYLNLADAYFKTENFPSAVKIYRDIYKKDSVLDPAHLNRMLRAIARTSGQKEVQTFLDTHRDRFSAQLLNNATFNFELLQHESKDNSNYAILNISANSPQADFSPAFYKDKLLFASSRPQQGSKKVYAPSGEAYLDIYEASIGAGGDVRVPTVFKSLSKTSFHKATPFYSPELNSLFYSLSNANGAELLYSDEGKNTLAIGMQSANEAYKYILRDLNVSFYYPYYEVATGRLFFAANFEEGYGGTDLYFVYTNNGLIMSAPINLGPRVNTPGNEIAPFVFDNSLYFSSDIFYGLGGMDIYKSDLQPNNGFSMPANLGPGINSGEDDFGFILKGNDVDGLDGYFSSNRKGGRGNDDIYGFKVSDKPGLRTLALKGKVQEPRYETGIDSAYVRLLGGDGTVLRSQYTLADGTYEVEIPWRDNVTLEVKKNRYSNFSKTLGREDLAALDPSHFNIGLSYIDDILEELEGRKVIKLNKYYFGKGKSAVTAEIAAELDKVVKALQSFPAIQLKIETYTDSRGTDSSNLALSQKRSDAIKEYLLQNGASPNNILEAKGYGEAKILNACKNGVFCLEVLHNRNERSLIILANYDQLFLK